MELREIYETLLRRGMPEHDELEWRGSEDFGIGVWVFNKSEPISFGNGPMFMGERYARDLITMHALRWLKTLPGMRGGCQRWQDGWNVFLDDDYWSGKKNDPRIYKFAANECLDAILAATAHLEPQKTLA